MRIGADIGGTFTDVVLEDGDRQFSTKVLTTYDAPERGVLDGMLRVLAEAGVDATVLTSVIHGTTLATNALINRTGARTAFITTAGFRDVVEMRTESRFEQYDLNLVLPTPLVDRRHRHVVPERLAADGSVLLPLDEAEASTLIDQLAAGTDDGPYEAVAIGLLHGYRNGAHERRLRDLLADRLPDVPVSISSEVAAQLREFERFNTVCANAYLQPLMAGYLHRLEAALADAGATCPLHLIHAVLSYDMGGTTAKICLIEDQTPRTAKTFEVARTQRFTKGSGMPVAIPVIEMIEIGAGGGSIAAVDGLGQIRVGPMSAGSEPGPAAYGLGGTDPTVSDANLVLGRLSPDTFGAPGIDLSSDAAATALLDGIGNRLGLDATTSAIGVAEVVDENMANAARVHAVENGKDVARFTMIAFGGGAPLHAGRLCDKLDIDAVLIPPGAGVGSAIGFLRAPFAYEAVRSHYAALDDLDVSAVDGVLADLEAEARGFVQGAITHSGAVTRELDVERFAYMRYAGQGWEIPVRLGDGVLAAELADRFEAAYTTFFGRPIDGLRIEAVSWSVRVATPRPPVDPVEPVTVRRDVTSDRIRPIHDAATGTVEEAIVVDRDDLEPGDRVTGPAVVAEEQTTTWLSAGQAAVLQADGCLLVTRGTTSGASA